MKPDGTADRSTRRGRKRRRDDGGVQGTDATAAATDASGDADVDTSLQALEDKIAELEDRDVTTREWAVFMEVLSGQWHRLGACRNNRRHWLLREEMLNKGG
jgi:hypothetical protein